MHGSQSWRKLPMKRTLQRRSLFSCRLTSVMIPRPSGAIDLSVFTSQTMKNLYLCTSQKLYHFLKPWSKKRASPNHNASENGRAKSTIALDASESKFRARSSAASIHHFVDLSKFLHVFRILGYSACLEFRFVGGSALPGEGRALCIISMKKCLNAKSETSTISNTAVAGAEICS